MFQVAASSAMASSRAGRTPCGLDSHMARTSDGSVAATRVPSRNEPAARE
ncbi:Uncharacterised protein [Mycobacteroides abscessus subsp. abscessus]|nr:Uncharacterised protein [Mycobacteroides abscessus subsp. abscessus]